MSAILTDLKRIIWKEQLYKHPENHIIRLGEDDSIDLALHIYETFGPGQPVFQGLRKTEDFGLNMKIQKFCEVMSFEEFMEAKAYEEINLFYGIDLEWFKGTVSVIADKEQKPKTQKEQ